MKFLNCNNWLAWFSAALFCSPVFGNQALPSMALIDAIFNGDELGEDERFDDPTALVTIDFKNDDDSAISKSVRHASRKSNDLVRAYLKEIGRVALLKPEEEVSEAQKVQRYMMVLQELDKAAESSEILQNYKSVVEVHNRLMSKSSIKPSLTKWAKESGIEPSKLKEIIRQGEEAWAEVTGHSVKELTKIETLGRRAKNHMISANLRLVVSVAKKFQNRGLELLDLIQEGSLGLDRAVEKFDPTKGFRFSTYAYWWIRQGITRAIATQGRTIRLPVHITEKLNKIKEAQRKLSQEKGRMPKLSEIANELYLTESQVRETLSRIPRQISLESKAGKDRDTELIELLEAHEQTPEEELMRDSLQKDLQDLLSELTERERDVIQMRFGFGNEKPSSLAEIGRHLELSRERVRQIEAKALDKLRQPRRRNIIRDYLESLN